MERGAALLTAKIVGVPVTNARRRALFHVHAHAGEIVIMFAHIARLHRA